MLSKKIVMLEKLAFSSHQRADIVFSLLIRCCLPNWSSQFALMNNIDESVFHSAKKGLTLSQIGVVALTG